jgi:hypothetical protein
VREFTEGRRFSDSGDRGHLIRRISPPPSPALYGDRKGEAGMGNDELNIESFMAQMSKYESNIRYWLTRDGDHQRVEAVDELIKLPYEGENDEAFITQMEKGDFSKDIDYDGLLFLRILNQLRENIFTEKYLPANYVVWLMNVSFIAAYAMGRFHQSIEYRMKNLRIGAPKTMEQMAAFAKYFIHHGEPKGDLPQTESIREAYNSFYDRKKKHPSWRQLYYEWNEQCEKEDSKIKKVCISDKKIYYKLENQNTKRSMTINHFKNLRTRFEDEKIVMLNEKDD